MNKKVLLTGGVVYWTPTAAGKYYYQSSAHNGMNGTITVLINIQIQLRNQISRFLHFFIKDFGIDFCSSDFLVS